MKDINTLSGIEFENLCQLLLQKAGFDVETTKASGDGGIDLIAHCRKPFFDGKYIIQCKRYSGGVGEPIIRDLYGVVMAEHANKGILMTTGYFSMSAINFSQNKNIELIDGEKMSELLAEYELMEVNHIQGKQHFTQHECFNVQKYDFFKKMVNQGLCTEEMGNDFLFSFLFDYFSNSKQTSKSDVRTMIHCGLAEEYLRLFDWYAGKYYKRGKEKNRILNTYTQKYKSVALLYNFDLFAYVQNKYTMLTQNNEAFSIEYCLNSTLGCHEHVRYKSFRLWCDWEDNYEVTKQYILANVDNPAKVEFKPHHYFFELMNLLALFSYFNIKTGISYVNKLLYGDYPEFKEFVESQKRYQEATQKVRIYYSYDVNAALEVYDIEEIDLTAYFDMHKETEKEKIASELSQIEALLSTLL